MAIECSFDELEASERARSRFEFRTTNERWMKWISCAASVMRLCICFVDVLSLSAPFNGLNHVFKIEKWMNESMSRAWIELGNCKEFTKNQGSQRNKMNRVGRVIYNNNSVIWYVLIMAKAATATAAASFYIGRRLGCRVRAVVRFDFFIFILHVPFNYE